MPIFANGTALATVRSYLNDTGLRKNNFAAVRAPLATDNAAAGYEPGSRWMYAGDEWVYTGSDWVQPTADLTQVQSDIAALETVVGATTVATGAAPVPAGWSPALWTTGEIYNPQLTAALAGHAYPVAVDVDGVNAVTLTNGQQITSKTVYRRQPHADVLLVTRYRATGVDGTSIAYVGAYHADDGATGGGRNRSGMTPVAGVNIHTHLIPAGDMSYRPLYRPFVRMTGAGSITVQYLQVTELA